MASSCRNWNAPIRVCARWPPCKARLPSTRFIPSVRRNNNARWLPGLVSGERVGCFGLTEHGHGSDPGGMETRAVRDGDHYVLNGSKCWIGNASIADVKVDLGKGRRWTRRRIRGGERRARISRPGYRGKIQSAHVAHVGMLVRELPYPGGNRLPNASGLRAPFRVFRRRVLASPGA